MTAAADFPTDDVLSVITGRLVSSRHMTGVYEVLNWMTGENVYTHQLPRISREARPVLLAAHPDLAAACEEAELVNPDNWREWRLTWLRRYGPTISVPKFNTDRLYSPEHKRIDPIIEAIEMVGPERVIVVKK